MNFIISPKRKRYIILFSILLPLCWFFPYTGDDWAWGSQIGLDRLNNVFDNYNGRYLGNLIVLLLTRSRVLRAITVSFVLTGIVYCIERIEKERWVFEVALSCLLFVPRLILRQAIVWTSGFANYGISIFLTLIFFVYVNEHSMTESEKHTSCERGLLLLLGICNTLIIEHLTVFHVVASVLIFFFYIIKYRKCRLDYMLYMIGCIIGCVCMFTNSAYHSIANHTDGYREVAGDGIIKRAYENYYGVIFREGYYYNSYLNILMVLACLIGFIYIFQTEKDRLIVVTTAVYTLINVIFLMVSFRTVLLYGTNYTPYSITAMTRFYGNITALSLLSTIFLTTFIYSKNGWNKRLLLLWGAALIMCAPLFAVTPIGGRCFFSSYVILILIVCEVYKNLAELVGTVDLSRMQKICLFLAILCVTRHYYIFGNIYKYDNYRLDHIVEAINNGKSSSELYRLPHEEYLWTSAPVQDNDLWEERYKLFYGIPQDFDLVVTPYDEISNTEE